MPGKDLVLDDSGDYVADGAGGFETTATAATAVRHQVLGELNTWVGDLEAGRVQRGIAGRTASEAEAIFERDSLLKGMKALQEAGLVDSTEVEVVKELPTRFAVGMRTRDTQSGGTIAIPEIAEFGV